MWAECYEKMRQKERELEIEQIIKSNISDEEKIYHLKALGLKLSKAFSLLLQTC